MASEAAVMGVRTRVRAEQGQGRRGKLLGKEMEATERRAVEKERAKPRRDNKRGAERPGEETAQHP